MMNVNKQLCSWALLSLLSLGLAACSSSDDALSSPAEEQVDVKTLRLNLAMDVADMPNDSSEEARMAYEFEGVNRRVKISLKRLRDAGRTTVPVYMVFKNTKNGRTYRHLLPMEIKDVEGTEGQELFLGIERDFNINMAGTTESDWYVKVFLGGSYSGSGTNVRIWMDGLWKLEAHEDVVFTEDTHSVSGYQRQPLPAPMMSDWVPVSFFRDRNNRPITGALPTTRLTLKPFGSLIRLNVTNNTNRDFTGTGLNFGPEGQINNQANKALVAFVNTPEFVMKNDSLVLNSDGSVKEESAYTINSGAGNYLDYQMTRNANINRPRRFVIPAGGRTTFVIWLIARMDVDSPNTHTAVLRLKDSAENSRPDGSNVPTGYRYVEFGKYEIPRDYFKSGFQYAINLSISSDANKIISNRTTKELPPVAR